MPPTLSLNIQPAALLPATVSPSPSPEIFQIPKFTFFPDALDLAENKLEDKSKSITEPALVKLANRFRKKHNKQSVNRVRRSTPDPKEVEKIKDKPKNKVYQINPEEHYVRKMELYGANGYNLEMKENGIVKAERLNTKFGKYESVFTETKLSDPDKRAS